MKLFTTGFALLFCISTFGQVPYIVNKNGVGSNTTLIGVTRLSAPIVTNAGSSFMANSLGTLADGTVVTNAPGLTNHQSTPITFDGRLTLKAIDSVNGQDLTWQTNRGPGWGIFQGFFDTMAPTPFSGNGVSGFRWLDQTAQNVWFTIGVNNDTANYDPIPRSYMATYVGNTNTSQQLGVSEYAHFPYVGGSGATLSGLPVHGQEIWSRMPVPPMVFTTWTPSLDGTNNCNEAYVSNVVRNLNLDGLVAACTNKGIPVMIDINAGWHGARDGNGYQTWNTTLFPRGIPFLANYCHTNAGRYVQLELHQYFSGRVSNNWFSVSPSYVQTPSTVNLVGRDIYQFYTWGIDSVLIADGAQEDASGSPGFAQLMTRQVCQELLYPGGLVPALKSFTNLISFNCFLTRLGPLGVGQSLVTPGAAYEINRWQDDQGDQAGPNPGVAIDRAMFQARVTWTNRAQFAGKGHYFSDVYVSESVVNDADWQSKLAMGVMFPYGMTIYTNNPSTAILKSLTNSTYLDIFADANQDPAFPIFDNGSGSTSAWCKPMSGGKFAVVFANESGSSAAMSFNWNQIVSPRSFLPVGTTTYPFSINSSQAYLATDVWNATNKGTFQGTFSDTVLAHTAGFYLFTPVAVELARARTLSLFNFLGVFANGTEGPSPQFWEDGFSIASTAGGFSYSVPTWTTQATVTCKMQASAVTAWTNTVLGFWSVSGADGRDWNTFISSNIVTSANPSITNYSFTVTWPVTNTVKYFRCTMGACSNSATRSFATPLQIIYQ